MHLINAQNVEHIKLSESLFLRHTPREGTST